MVRRLAACLATLCLLHSVTPAQERGPGFKMWATDALRKIRPKDPPPSASGMELRLSAARNEFEPFQVVLRSDGSDIDGVDVEVSDFAGPGASVLHRGRVSLYFERYMNLKIPSSVEGEAGEWPDPLIPKIDSYHGEKRNAFPFRLARGRNQPLWIEIYVPPQTTPGTYKGSVIVTANGTAIGAVPVTIQVWRFALPSTSSLRTAFGFNGVTVLKQHQGHYTNDEDLSRLTFVYTEAALMHRISLIIGTLIPPPFTQSPKGIVIDWRNYDREVGPFLDGTVFQGSHCLAGARATSIDLRTHGSMDTDEKKVLYWKEWVRHFAGKGWLDRLFYYVWDEPKPEEIPKVARLARLARRADPKLATLVTTPRTKELEGLIDIWTPLINCFESKPGLPDFCERVVPREVYEPELKQGKKLWWYQSCGSHGCGGIGGEYFRGWPSYMIDVAASANRIMEWLSWTYGVQGELYFNTTEAYADSTDPLKSVYKFGGNGDGTLFYPGRPQQIGGSTHIPIESIRLKLIREGLEDYEYLNLLSQMGLSSETRKKVNQMIQKTYHWDRAPKSLYAIREDLARELDSRFSKLE